MPETPPTPNLSAPIKRHFHDCIDADPTSYDLYGIPTYNRHIVTGRRSILLTERSVGWPPGSYYNATDEGNDEIDTASFWPQYGQILKNEGYKNRGCATILDYPGGVNAYFERFCKPMIKTTLALAVDPAVVGVQPYFLLSYVPPDSSMAKVALYNGFVCVNAEMFYPMTSWFWRSGAGRATGSWYHIYYKRLEVLLGRTPTDQETRDSYYEQVIYGLALKTIREIRKHCPRARVSFYNWPNNVPIFISWPLNSIGHTEQVAEIQAGGLDAFWRECGAISPSAYIPYEIVDDSTNPVPIGKVRYSTLAGYDEPMNVRAKLIRSRTGVPIVPWIWLLHGSPLATYSPITCRYLMERLNLMGANAVIIWGNSSAGVNASAGVLSPYASEFARTASDVPELDL